MAMADKVMAAVPRAVPPRERLQRCKIISHRGEHDNRTVMENTLQAFDAARAAGVWGIECDVRWTADLVPVICHDPTPARVFGVDSPVCELSFNELRASVPNIPSLAEVVEDFGGSVHLMLELKAEHWPARERQAGILKETLAGLLPVEEFHLLALDIELLDRVDFIPPRAKLPVAELNVGQLSRQALAAGYAGIGGHYLLLNRRLKRLHDEAGQQLGSGFPASRNCLFRELNRGIEWIFTNRAVALQAIRDEYLRAAGGKIT